MSFVDVKPYFQARMKATDADLNEWQDAFDVNNIPATVIDKAWHIRVGTMSYQGSKHECLAFGVPVDLKVCLKGYRSPYEAVDNAHGLADAIIKECCKSTTSLNQANIKNVIPNLVNVREIGPSNDNLVVLEISFNVLIYISP